MHLFSPFSITAGKKKTTTLNANPNVLFLYSEPFSVCPLVLDESQGLNWISDLTSPAYQPHLIPSYPISPDPISSHFIPIYLQTLKIGSILSNGSNDCAFLSVPHPSQVPVYHRNCAYIATLCPHLVKRTMLVLHTFSFNMLHTTQHFQLLCGGLPSGYCGHFAGRKYL